MTTPERSLNAIHAAADADLLAIIEGKHRTVTAHNVPWGLAVGDWLHNWPGDRIGYVVASRRLPMRTPALALRVRLLDGWLYKGRLVAGRDSLVLNREGA